MTALEPSPPSIPNRGRRHSSATMIRVRSLRADGWRPAEIQRLLAADGIEMDTVTISKWTDPRIAARVQRNAERYRAAEAAAAGARGGLIRVKVRPEFKLARMQALADRGVSAAAIATLMDFDFGDSLTRNQVRYALKVGRYPNPGANDG